MFRGVSTKSILLLLVSLVPLFARAQDFPWPEQLPAQNNQQAAGDDNPSSANVSVRPRPPVRITIPAGTRVLMALQSPMHTTSGTQGSGLYLVTLYPVIQDNQIVIPAHTQVQGVVENDQRPGHIQRSAEFKFRFTTMIFPNNHIASIDGALQSIPGSATTRAQHSDGTLQTVDQAEKVVTPAAVGAGGGAVVGSLRGTGVGTYIGAGLGAGLGLGSVLLKRGDEISLPRGTNVEMVLRSSLVLNPDQVEFNARYVPPANAEADAKDRQFDVESGRREKPRRARPMPSLFPLPSLWR
jgi:hypothetical protein